MKKNVFQEVVVCQDKIAKNREKILDLGNKSDPKTDQKRIDLVADTVKLRDKITEITR